MTIIATGIYMFFAISLASQAPQLSVLEAQFSPQTQKATDNHLVTQTHAVTTTQRINTTKQVPLEPKTRELYRRVAARSLGEGSSALAEIACTIKNRLERSKSSLTVVLRAYYAHDRRPRLEHIELVRKVFEGELPCPATWWYALSAHDTRRFRPHAQPALIVKRDPRDQIWIFDR